MIESHWYSDQGTDWPSRSCLWSPESNTGHTCPGGRAGHLVITSSPAKQMSHRPSSRQIFIVWGSPRSVRTITSSHSIDKAGSRGQRVSTPSSFTAWNWIRLKCPNCRRLPRLPPGDGAQATEDSIHQAPDVGAREGAAGYFINIRDFSKGKIFFRNFILIVISPGAAG